VERTDPPLEELLVTRDQSVGRGRWENRALVAVKVKSLPKILSGSKTAELEALRLKIEQTALDLAHEKELAKDKAQRLVEKNQAATAGGESADELREIALVYQERIEILKAILAGIQEEVANRGR
jgi:hypothetical protein